MAEDKKSEGSEGSVKDFMKKILLTGVGTVFLTEETIRNYLSEVKLPKELWAGLIENAGKTKQEFLATFAKEAAQVLKTIDIASEAKKFLEKHTMKVSVEISFSPNKGKSKDTAAGERAEED